LEESRVSTIENSKKHALVQDVVSGHQKQVDESLNEIERLKNEITKLQNERTSYLKKSENNVKRIEERNELERMRWKKDMDDKDKRIKNLEKACRERDAEKIQRIANTVSSKISRYQTVLLVTKTLTTKFVFFCLFIFRQ